MITQQVVTEIKNLFSNVRNLSTEDNMKTFLELVRDVLKPENADLFCELIRDYSDVLEAAILLVAAFSTSMESKLENIENTFEKVAKRVDKIKLMKCIIILKTGKKNKKVAKVVKFG